MQRRSPTLMCKVKLATSLILAAGTRRTFHITHLLAPELVRGVGCPATFGSLQERWGKRLFDKAVPKVPKVDVLPEC